MEKKVKGKSKGEGGFLGELAGGYNELSHLGGADDREVDFERLGVGGREVGDLEKEGREVVGGEQVGDEIEERRHVLDSDRSGGESISKNRFDILGFEDDELRKDLEDLKSDEGSALTVLPAQVKFETQEMSEEVILVMRRHPITNLKWMVVAVLMALMPLFIIGINMVPVGLGREYVVMVSLVWELVVVGFVFEEYLRWYFNIYVVTDRRIVDIDFNHLLSREINDADLLKIEDVTVKSQGVGAAIFNYGNVFVQTAAERGVFEFHTVKDAEKVASVIRLLALHREKVLRRRDN